MIIDHGWKSTLKSYNIIAHMRVKQNYIYVNLLSHFTEHVLKINNLSATRSDKTVNQIRTQTLLPHSIIQRWLYFINSLEKSHHVQYRANQWHFSASVTLALNIDHCYSQLAKGHKILMELSLLSLIPTSRWKLLRDQDLLPRFIETS